MAHIVQSLENAVEAGVQGIIGIAEGFVGATAPATSGNGSGSASAASKGADAVAVDTAAISASAPIPIVASGAGENGFAHALRAQNDPSPTSLASRLAIASQDTLVQLADVPSGWIHVQSTYLDAAGGQKRVRSFGLRNVSDGKVDVEIGSDLGHQVVFWTADDEKAPSSSESSTSSLSNSAGSPSLNLSLPVGSTTTVFLAFQPTSSQPASPAGGASTPSTDDGFTPRVLPAGAAGTNTELSPVPRLPSAASTSTSILSDTGSNAASQSSMSASGSIVRDASTSTRRSDPVHRSFSVHGSILVRATKPVQWDDHAADTLSPPFPVGPQAHQNVSLPFFATVCRSFFSAALIDPATGLATAPQLQAGQLLIDFGCDNVVGTEAHRDIILVNRSEIDLIWNTTVVNARHKDSVWFSLRDLDSENVFGVDNSPEPVPLPALSSRHLRLSLRPLAPVPDFDFDFVISNVHQSGNAVNVRATGSCGASPHDNTLRILSGTSLDFGQIPDGSWAKKLVIAKNMGDRPIDVHFSATPGYDVVYRLAGVAGEDIDEDVPVRPRDKRAEVLSRTSTKDTRDSNRGRDIASTLRYAASEAPGPGSSRSHVFTDASSVTTDTRTLNESEDWSAFGVSDRESSIPPSRPLSRVTSRASSYRPTRGENESDDEDSQHLSPNETGPTEESKPSDNLGDRDIPNQIEELTMRPGTEYRVFAMYRPARDLVNPPDIAGALRSSSFRLFFDWAPSSQRSRPGSRTRQAVHCSATSCTSIISIPSGHLIDFGEVTVGASKSTTIQIENMSALSARVEIAAISKVLNTNRSIIVIPPFETVNERIDFFPRRINERYEKQVFVRNLLNRENNQLIEVRSKNVDVYNVTLHSHLYRILTPSGSNFLDFGSVVINSPSIRTVQFQNLTQKPLVLDLTASQPEDVELYVKAGDAPVPQVAPAILAKYNYLTADSERPNGNLKERFVESLQDKDQGANDSKPPSKSKAREKSVTRGVKEGEKASIGSSLAATLKKGGRGKHVQLYGDSVTFKDRTLLDDAEYLDLASGLPISAHRIPATSKRTQLLESIAHEDKTKLSGQHPKVLKLDFSTAAKASGLYLKEPKPKKVKSSSSTKRDPSTPGRHREPSSVRRDPSTPGRNRDQAPPTTPSRVGSRTDAPSSPTTLQPILKAPILKPQSAGSKSPALTGKRIELKGDPASVSDVTKLSPDELIVAIEQHEARRSTQAVTHLTSEEEEQYVRRLLALRKEFQNSVSGGKFVAARVLTVPPGSSRQLVVLMTPNGSTRPHISTRAKRAESRIFIKLMEYDHSLLSSAVGESFTELSELPVRDLVIRSSCVRSVLEVQQSSINFGTCERGEIKSRTIVIHNKSDCVGVFRMRTSGSIASGNLKLGLGRYGVISAFGRKEVASFSFTPTMVGNFQETIAVENVLDSFNDQNVLVKATVRKMPALSLDVTKLDIVPTSTGEWPSNSGFVITNMSKTERTFVVEAADAPAGAFADISLALDEKDAGVALSKVEEEEVEAMLQKLKIARRKNKPDKIAKYEKRLAELGVTTATPEPERAADAETGSAPLSGAASPVVPSATASRCVVVTLQANKKAKILVNLVPGSDGTEAFVSTVKVFDRKNTDESVTIDVSAQPKPVEQAPAPIKPTSEDPLNLAIMRHCLELTLKCPVSPTAFCVGSTLFLPTSEPLFATLKPYFSTFTHPVTGGDAGLILADGYSRQIPGNTHAEANALTNFRERMTELEDSHPEASLPSASEVLAQSECFATMEPCSVRTSGGPSCAHELVRAHVKTVFLGVEEPPDFVQCEGVNILEQGGVQVSRVVGLEEECLELARRGRS